MKIGFNPYTLPQQPAGNHVRFAQPPSTTIGEDLASAARDTLEADDAASDVSDSDSDLSISDAGPPSPFDSSFEPLPFPCAPEPPPVGVGACSSSSWASRLVGVFDFWVERLEQVVEILRITVTGYADDMTGKVTEARGTLVGAIDAVSSVITTSLENLRFRVHGFLGRKV